MASPLWTADEIAAATGGRWISTPGPDWAPTRVSYDVTGRMTHHFCALVHPATWGNGRRDPAGEIPRLARQNAAGIMTQQDHLDGLVAAGGALPAGLPVLQVSSTWDGLRKMAEAARARFAGKVFALTGTVGKTTTREMIRHLTGLQGGASASAANNNNISGVHRTLACMPREHAAVAVEMGFGKPLDGIERSSRVARPDVALLTTIDVAHLDMFTAEMLAQASGRELLCRHKAGIFAGLEPGGAAVICADIPEYRLACDLARAHTDRVYGFGSNPVAEGRMIALETLPSSSRVTCVIFGKRHVFTVNVPGRHMAMNALGALTAVSAAGFDTAQAVQDIESFAAVAGRARHLDLPLAGGGRATIIDDSFNATLASMRSTFDLLDLAQPGPGGRRIAVIGEIGHVGANEAEEHLKLARHIGDSRVDLVYSWGPLMRPMFKALPRGIQGAHEDTSVEALYERLRPILRDGDVLTVKSGRGVNGLGDIRFRKFVEHLVAGKPSLTL
jgi:UDP-N-acetylmuramoyl-tripeptide--D-alanyl-D-alanine ligase